MLAAQSCPTLCDPMTVAHQAPLFMKFSRQEHRSGKPFLLQGIFLTQGLNPGRLHCREILYCLNHQGSPSTPKKSSVSGKVLLDSAAPWYNTLHFDSHFPDMLLEEQSIDAMSISSSSLLNLLKLVLIINS